MLSVRVSSRLVVVLSMCDVLSIMSPRVSCLVRICKQAKVFMWFRMCAVIQVDSLCKIDDITVCYIQSLLGVVMAILAGRVVAISFTCLVRNHDVLYSSRAMRPRCWSTLDLCHDGKNAARFVWCVAKILTWCVVSVACCHGDP